MTIILSITLMAQELTPSTMTIKLPSSAINPSYCGTIKSQLTKMESSWTTFPIAFQIDSTVPDYFQESIRKSAQMWNTALGFPAISISENMASLVDHKLSKNNNVIAWSTNPQDLRPKTEGETFMTWKGSKIKSANILLNAAYYQFSFEGMDPNKIDLTSLMLHEFGHALGLEHSLNEDSVMRDGLKVGEIRQDFSEEDLNIALCSIEKTKVDLYNFGSVLAEDRP